jgi:U4/U6 small nuclear ribonucleoprotein PRP4
MFFAVLFGFRAQKRVAQQLIDSRIPLGKLIDLRKKIFANVKVGSP